MGSHRWDMYRKASALSSVPAPVHPRSCWAHPSTLWADRRHWRGVPQSCLPTDPHVRCSRPLVVRAWSQKRWQASGMPPSCFRAAVEHWHLCERGDPTCQPVQAEKRTSTGLVDVRVVATCRPLWRCCVRLSASVFARRLCLPAITFVARHGGDLSVLGWDLRVGRCRCQLNL